MKAVKEKGVRDGWKESPKCRYVRINEEGKLFCAYDYMASNAPPRTDLVRQPGDWDVFIKDWTKSDEFMTKYRLECSPDNCPKFLYRTTHRKKAGR